MQGTPIQHKIMGLFPVPAYAWQIISYHSFLCLHVGMIQEGLQSIKLIYDRMYRWGFPWSANLHANADENYMTHGVLWGILTALSGTTLDLLTKTLRISPKHFSSLFDDEEVYPVCFPSFWGLMALRFTSSHSFTGSLKILKVFGKPISISSLEYLHPSSDSLLKQQLQPPWILQPNQTFSISF